MRLNISQIHLLVINGSFDLFGNRKPNQALIVLCMHAKEKRKKSYPKYKPSCTPALTPHTPLQPLHDDRRRGTTAVADGSDALLTLLQSVHQGDDNSGTRGTDRLRFSSQFVERRGRESIRKRTYVTEGDGTALDVDLGPVQTEHPFSRDAHHGKGLVEFPEGDLVLGHTGILEGKGYGEGRGGGEVDGSTGGVGEAFFADQVLIMGITTKKNGDIPRILARGFKPSFSTTSPEAKTTAEAPSLRVDALAAVTVPFSLTKTGLMVLNLSFKSFLYSSSSLTTTSPFRPLTVTGAISSANASAAHASWARV